MRIVRIARKGMGKGGRGMTTPYEPVEYPNTMRSKATARVLELVSEGPIYGYYHARFGQPWRSVYLDDTPVQADDGTWNFNIAAGDTRYGSPNQDPIPGWPIAEAEYAVAVEMKPYDPVVRSLNVPVSAIRYKVRVAALYMTEDDGDVSGTDVAYSMEYRVDGGGWQMPVFETIYGKTMSPYERQVRVELPYTTGSIDVRLTRQQPMPNDSSEQNGIFFSSYTEITDGQISYDDSAVVSLAVDAEEFSNLPKRSYLLDGVMVQVPNVYDGINHSYSSNDWDGTFTVQWTNNPAWLLYAFLTNERWGLGRSLDVNAIDKWSFFQSALYNDQPVPNGVGGYEFRHTCNAVINTRQDAYTVLQAIASNMMGQIYYANGTIFLVQDRRLTTPERIFGPADVLSGVFEYQSADVRTRFTAAAVSWNDPSDRYEIAVELVVDAGMVAEQGYKETQVSTFGCTTQGQAQRYGRWIIYTSQFETETVTFRVALENADLRPGQLISINDPGLAGARLAGRLLENDSTDTVTLDRLPNEVPWGADNVAAWRLIVTVGDATQPDNPPRVYDLGVYEVQPPASLKLTSAKPEPFPPGSMWLLHASVVEARPWRVNTVSDQGDGTYQVTCTEYHVEKFDYVEYGVLIPPPSYSLIPHGPLLAPSNLLTKEYIYLDARGIPQFGVIFSWTPSPDARVTRYQLELAGPAGDYRIYRQISGVAQDVPAMRDGAWQVVLVASDNLGRKSRPVVIEFSAVGLTAKPLPPRALFITPNGRLTTLIWVPSGEIDVMFYWVKWSPEVDDVTWNRATTSIAQVDRNTTQIVTPTRSGTFLVKCIDSLGQESEQWIAAVLIEQITDDVFDTDIIEQNEQIVEFDFMIGALPPDTTLTRPSTGWFINDDHAFAAAGVDVPRFDYGEPSLRGLLNEPAATNLLRNASGIGAVAGSPGTPPTNWSTANTAGLSQAINFGTEDGIPFVDVRFAGTAGATGTVSITFDTATGIPATAGGYHASLFVRLAAGAWPPGISPPTLRLSEYNSGGTSLLNHDVVLTQPTGAALRTQRQGAAFTLTEATLAFARPTILWTTPAVGIDMTIRVGLPQLVRSSVQTSPIVTTTAAVTRAADVLTVNITGDPWSGGLRIERENGTTTVPGPIAPGPFVVPVDVSPVESVAAFDSAWNGDKGPYWEVNDDTTPAILQMPPPLEPEPVPPGVFPGDRATVLNQVPTRMGVYLFDNELDLGVVSSVSMVAIVYGYGYVPGFEMATWVPLAIAIPLAMGASDQWDAHIEVRISQDGTTFDDWAPLKSALLTGRRFQWRLVGTVYDLRTTARIIKCQVHVDVPLRNISGVDVELNDTGHLTVTYTVPFMATPTVQITGRQSLAPGGSMVITASTPDHFTIEHRDSAGNPFPYGSIDYFVQGYGGGVPTVIP